MSVYEWKMHVMDAINEKSIKISCMPRVEAEKFSFHLFRYFLYNFILHEIQAQQQQQQCIQKNIKKM